MKHASSPLFTTLRLLTLTLACITSPAHADEYGDVGQLLRAGKFNEAMTKADNYLAGKPNDPQMRFLKGVIQRNAGKTADAIVTFTKLTEDYPELPEPYNNLAVLYAGQSQFDKARTALEMAIRTNPSYATAHENLGDVYARLASQAYNKALQIDGANPAVPPKLALIREVFKPNLTNNQRSNAPTPAPAPNVTAAPTPPVAPPVVVTPVKPAVVVPVPTPAPAPPVTAPPVKAVTTPTPAPAPVKAAPVSNESASEVEAAVRAWAKAWSAKDVSAYLNAYGKQFDPPGNQSRSAWEQERRQRIIGKNSISVKLEHLTVSVNGNKAVVKFRQNYKADALAVSSHKTLNMSKSGNHWLILTESTGG